MKWYKYPAAVLLANLYSLQVRDPRLSAMVRKYMLSPCRNGVLDLHKKLLAIKFVQPGDLVIDAGAHIGTYSQFYASLVKELGKVIAFEPHPKVFAKLEENASLLPCIELHNAALSSEVGSFEMKLYPDDISQQCSTLEPRLMNQIRMPGNCEMFRVKTEKLDELEVNSCALLKIDVEGHEHAVLAGGLQFLERHMPIVIMEYGTDPDYAPPTIEQLQSIGYSVYDGKTAEAVKPGYLVPITDLFGIPPNKQKEFQQLASILKRS